MSFEDIIMKEYLHNTTAKYFCDWAQLRLGALGLVINCIKEVRLIDNMGGVTVQWTTQIFYENNMVALEPCKFSDELKSLSEALAIALNNRNIPEDIKKKVWDIQYIIIEYVRNTWHEDQESAAKTFVNLLKKYDNGESIAEYSPNDV